LFTLNKKAARQNINTTPTPKRFVVPLIPDIEPTFTKTPTLGDFDVLKMIGKGASGKVFLVRNKATQEIYSLKVVPKSGRFEDVIREQGLLRAIEEGGDTACFVLSLVASWHDTENYYLLTVRLSCRPSSLWLTCISP
jgi:serine/threonine protein kinase